MPPFISYAQNREDVVLFRALGHIPAGRYVEVGANHPTHDSATFAFYERGWRGLTVEPVPYFADLHREQRPRDTLVEAAVTHRDVGEVTLHVVPGTGLSTIVDAVSDQHVASGIATEELGVPAVRLDALLADQGWSEDEDIHFLLVDVEGAEQEVLQSIDLRRWRPWVLVIEATEPNSTASTHGEWEDGVLEAGYEYCLFDGLSRYYVAAERASELKAALSYPACVHDGYLTHGHDLALQKVDRLLTETTHWRTVALTQWADVVGQVGMAAAEERARLAEELEAIRNTLSWRITRPLRGVRTVLGRVRSS
ncbi:FkbM family methyltransferase [Blastococcus sp. PRF04-17]|uniref:FkbM family methyltransferase n=1 Tax=Blastococcus sp. PRF04-17 TaxID=2933797 RepID=UPI001FF32F49|nr:FkbM family methyltransferase [Blastococcus sp. PRF04-17]UOY01228.1 FkbM family methyltransferase [Blastococcus sp. PRF04-17]